MEEERQKSWFSRNWGWVLGGGCLTAIIIGVLVIGAVIYKVSDSIKESEPYVHAFTKATTNDKVIEFLGSPIEANGMGNTSYKSGIGSTKAELTIPIKGPKDEGQIIVKGEKISDEWSYSSLYVKIDGEVEVINLLEIDTGDSLEDF